MQDPKKKDLENLKEGIKKLMKLTYAEKEIYGKVSKMIDNLALLLNHEIEDREVDELRKNTIEALKAITNLELREESLERDLIRESSKKVLNMLKEKYNIDENEIKELKELEKLIELSGKTDEEKKRIIINTIASLNKHIKELIRKEEEKIKKVI